MRVVAAVALDLLREAASRRWFLALWGGVTLCLAILGVSLRLDVVDGALSASRLFGASLSHDIRSAEVALRPVFQAMTYVVFYGGLAFGVLACSDFAPELLSPGRIEHLLSLPVRRWELVVGTFVGVMALAVLGTLYGATGFTAVVSVKAGLWTVRPIAAALLACVAFAAVYAVMLTTALYARSAALSAAVGALVVLLGILAGYRHGVAEAFEGATRGIFLAVTAGLPRVSSLADRAADIAVGKPLDAPLVRPVVGAALFTLAALALGIYRFERKDF